MINKKALNVNLPNCLNNNFKVPEIELSKRS
jgi:hypothetical protein